MSDNANADRRRLLKASAAAPLITSITPSSAFAMSSATACVLRPGVDNPATAVRVDVTRLDKRPPPSSCGDTNLQQSNEGEESQSDEDETVRPLPQECNCDGPDVLYRYLGEYYVPLNPEQWQSYERLVDEDCYDASDSSAIAAFQIDDQGLPVSVLGPLPANGGGSAISHSCLTSLIGNGFADPR